jgi:hypothetical protein
MDIVKIQSLISQDRVISLSDIITSSTYIQVGVFQQGNRPSGGGNADTYSPYVISIAELLSGITPPTPSSVVFVSTTISLNTTSIQTLAFPANGIYIVDSVIVTNASIDLSTEGVMNLTLTLPGTGGPSFDTAVLGPPASDLLNQLYIPDNYIYMTSDTPACFPPPCNGSFVYDGATIGTMNFEVVTPTVSEANVDVYVKLLKIA